MIKRQLIISVHLIRVQMEQVQAIVHDFKPKKRQKIKMVVFLKY